jgi:hypothetical protein
VDQFMELLATEPEAHLTVPKIAARYMVCTVWVEVLTQVAGYRLLA